MTPTHLHSAPPAVQAAHPSRGLILSAAKDLRIPLAAALLLALAIPAHTQGCAQCLDSTRATPPSVQAAYRHAILLLASVSAGIFIAATLLLRKQR